MYKESGKPAIAASTSAALFALYLQGHTCEEISKLNPGFGLGAIVRARVEDDWDARRLEHTQALLDGIRQTVQRAQLGAMQFVVDGMAAFHKMAGEKFQRYLQTGDQADLGDFKDMNFKTYKDLLEMLMKLTGQESGAKKASEPLPNSLPTEVVAVAPNATPTPGVMSADDAFAFLGAIKKETK